jgi:hypothetical protein
MSLIQLRLTENPKEHLFLNLRSCRISGVYYGFTRIARAAENHKVTIVLCCVSSAAGFRITDCGALTGGASIAIDHRIADGADALHRDAHFIASHQRPDASRRTGQNQIARKQSHYL